MVAMSDPTSQPDPRKVRIGLAVIASVVAAAVVLFFVIDAPAGKGLMVVIAAVAIVRMFLLTRWVRRGGPSA